MDLESFVANTLAQIARGIRKAQEETDDIGAWINPAGSIQRSASVPVIQTDLDAHAYLESVCFDIAVTVADDQRAGAGAGIQVFGIANLGAKGETHYQNAAVSRVQFRVPVAWPAQRKEALEKKRAAKRKQEATATTRRARLLPRYF